MAEDFRMDSHKLMLHPKEVARWLDGENIYPICMEISPSGICNHRCAFCGLDYLGYSSGFLDRKLIIENLSMIAHKGLKSIVVAGEGEPFLNKETPQMINDIKNLGLDVALSTNGVLFSKEKQENCLSSLSWVRFSFNAGTKETYAQIHGTKEIDFEKALTNIKTAVEIKKQNNLKVTIGVQTLLLDENVDEIKDFAIILKNIGVDYYAIKPYSKHPKSINSIGENVEYEKHLKLEGLLKSLAGDDFNIIFRAESMKKKKQNKCYENCLGIPFWAYINSNAEVYACIAYIGDENFSYGNLKNQNIVDIWNSQKKKDFDKMIETHDIKNCRELCRLDQINTYLNQIKNPFGHDNFI